MRRVDRALHAYFDGELGRLARMRFEAHLRRSPELRQRLEALRLIRAGTRDCEPSGEPHDVWGAISGRLASIDAQVEGEQSERSVGWAWAPRAFGTAALAAAAVVAALVLSSGSGDPIAPSGIQAAGVIRYLDTGDRSVMLVEDRDDVTIIWMMDPAGREV